MTDRADRRICENCIRYQAFKRTSGEPPLGQCTLEPTWISVHPEHFCSHFESEY